MSRKRFITSEMSTDERLAEVAAEEPIAALIWPWILLELDDWGRAEFKPLKMKLSLFPACQLVSADVLVKSVAVLSKHGLLAKYEVEDKTFVAVHPKKWLKFQTYLVGTKRANHSSNVPSNPAWTEEECFEYWVLMTRQNERDSVSRCQLTSGTVSRCLGLSVPSPSPSHIKNKNPLPPKGDDAKKTSAYSESFEAAWSMYPKKTNKGAAFKAWQKAIKRDMPVADMPAHIESRMFEPDWRKDDGKYIPHMATWLNADGWLDEGARITTPQAGDDDPCWMVDFWGNQLPKDPEVQS